MPYVCTQCGGIFPDYRIACPECGTWGSLTNQTNGQDADREHPIPLPDVVAPIVPRTKSGIESFDRLLGGGFVQGESILLVGPPGAGKSTFLLQLIGTAALPALYVSGEETIQQLKLRADRLAVSRRDISLLYETDLGNIIAHTVRTPVRMLVIDSVQTIYTVNSSTLPGSTTQIRKCAYKLRRIAQEQGMVLFLVGQITKEKRAAGPKLLEHAMDIVLELEIDQNRPCYRLLRSSKNRFGSTVTQCVLRMTDAGFLFLNNG
jgi:DNA repair protein RadA/Sms